MLWRWITDLSIVYEIFFFMSTLAWFQCEILTLFKTDLGYKNIYRT